LLLGLGPRTRSRWDRGGGIRGGGIGAGCPVAGLDPSTLNREDADFCTSRGKCESLPTPLGHLIHAASLWLDAGCGEISFRGRRRSAKQGGT